MDISYMAVLDKLDKESSRTSNKNIKIYYYIIFTNINISRITRHRLIKIQIN